MKEKFEKAQVVVIEFENEDVITTSNCGGPLCQNETEETEI